MCTTKRRYPKEEIVRRGEAIFEQIRPRLKRKNLRHFLAIDIETGEYEIDQSEMRACTRLRERLPEAQIWMRKVGSPVARRLPSIRLPRAVAKRRLA
jgi:hypothetical protein